MTNEEAIKIINSFDVGFEPYKAEEIAQAIDKAIEALKNERLLRAENEGLKNTLILLVEILVKTVNRFVLGAVQICEVRSDN